MGRGDGSGGGGGNHGRRRSWLSLFRRKKSADARKCRRRTVQPEAQPAGVLALFRALKRRDLSPFVDKINQGLQDAAQHAERLGLSDAVPMTSA